jgi:hypothetical protein
MYTSCIVVWLRTNIASDGELVREATRHIGNVSEGELVRYPAWHSMGLPE